MKKNGQEGSVTNCIFSDNSGKICVVFWKEEYDKIFGSLIEGCVYTIGEAVVKRSDPKFSKTSHPCELTCTRTTKIHRFDSATWLEKFKVSLPDLSKIPVMKDKEGLTTVVIVLNAAESIDVARKDGTYVEKTTIQVYDSSGTQVEVLAWGDAGSRLKEVQEHDPIILANISIKQYLESFHLKFDNNSRIFKDLTEVDQTITTGLLKFRNHRKSNSSEV